MTMQKTHWLEYGEPIEGEQAVEAIHRITHQTGPNEAAREDDVTVGKLSYEGLEIGFGENDNAEHVHDDGSLMVSGLDEEKRERVMDEFEPVAIEWESEIELSSENSEYDREARGELVIDGPQGRLVALKRYRAMIEEGNELQKAGEISEYIQYYRAGEDESFADGRAGWDVAVGELADEKSFVDECRAALEVDPEIEYELHAERL